MSVGKAAVPEVGKGVLHKGKVDVEIGIRLVDLFARQQTQVLRPNKPEKGKL